MKLSIFEVDEDEGIVFAAIGFLFSFSEATAVAAAAVVAGFEYFYINFKNLSFYSKS
jgi:hypothetical protein